MLQSERSIRRSSSWNNVEPGALGNAVLKINEPSVINVRAVRTFGQNVNRRVRSRATENLMVGKVYDRLQVMKK